jgi:hypothetical protein
MNWYFWINAKRRKFCYVGFLCKTKKEIVEIRRRNTSYEAT